MKVKSYWTCGKGMTGFSVAFVSVQEIEDLDRYRKLVAQAEEESAAVGMP